MNSHLQMYKFVRTQTPYESYIKKKKQIQYTKERLNLYEQILKFRQSRYPRQLMIQLERQINPFQLSLDKLKQFYNSKFPQYSNELVHQAVQYVFKRKCQESEMVKQSSMIIEYGEESIRNGRKLQKQDFSYFYDRAGFDQLQDNSKDKSLNKKDLNTSRKIQPIDKEDSPSKLYQDIQIKTEKFNKMLADQINREKNRFENIQLIEQGNPKDIIYQGLTSRRDKGSDSFPRFRETDLIIQPEGGFDTGRTDIEELNYLLGGITVRDEQQLGDFTGRSRGSSFTVKISKDVMDNLYNARGKLKLDLVRRVVDKLKKDSHQ